MANIINSLTFGDSTGVFSIPYGSCSTVGSTAAKTVSITNFALETGAEIIVKFTYDNTATSPTLNVTSTGAKKIYYRGSEVAASFLSAGTYALVYDGTNWEIIGENGFKVSVNTSSTSNFPITAISSTTANQASLAYNNSIYITPKEGRITASQFNASSDARLKENFEEYRSTKSILDLPIYRFDFIEGAKNQIGCKAQDLQEICPEVVAENSDGYLSIQENKIVYLLIEEVKKLSEEIKRLKNELDNNKEAEREQV